jgi:hypothetical protein
VPIFDLFHKRQRALRGEVPDVYTYASLPVPLRVQIVHIWHDVLGTGSEFRPGPVLHAYDTIVNVLRRELGVFCLPGARTHDLPSEELVKYFLEEPDVEQALSAVELTFCFIDVEAREWDYLQRHDASARADAAIDELNGRFLEHGVGYQFVDRKLIRIDSELVHSEVVKPALRLLSKPMYAGAQQEFLKAHEHYRHGNAKEALNECLKAFESAMKAICSARGWAHKPGATSKELIHLCLEKELVPRFWETHYASLRQLLESSVPTGRNKLSGHGQGAQPTEVPPYVVAYMLHMTASAIVFLADAESAMAS